MRTKYRYDRKLTGEERTKLTQLTSKGKASARTIKRAQILLLADEGKPDQAIAEVLHVSKTTAYRTRRKLAEKGLDSALKEGLRPGKARKLDGKRKLFLLRRLAVSLPRGEKSGQCGFLPTKWSCLKSSILFQMRRYAEF
jgi:hypothetical protein